MQIPSEWEEPHPEERSLRVAILHEAVSALSPRPPICIRPDTLVGQAVRLMNDHRIGALLVTAPDDSLIGIFTERDVLKKIAAGGISLDAPVRDVMTPGPCCLHKSDALVFALKLMHEG